MHIVIISSSYHISLSLTPFSSREGRLNVKIRDYVSKYNFGAPVAGNFFQAQYDSYVPTLLAQVK